MNCLACRQLLEKDFNGKILMNFSNFVPYSIFLVEPESPQQMLCILLLST